MASNSQFSTKFVKKLQGRVEAEYQAKAKAEEALKQKEYHTKKIQRENICTLGTRALKFDYLMTQFNHERLLTSSDYGFPPKVIGWEFERKENYVWGELEIIGKIETITVEVRLTVPPATPDNEIINIEWPWPHRTKEN